MTDGTAIIRIGNGTSAGKTFTVTADGVRIGRSSKNDIVLTDPLLSRYHCRLFMKDGGLWVADLGSANETLLNNQPVTEAPVYAGNTVTIGDTVMHVVGDGRTAGAAPGPGDGSVDLGFGAGLHHTGRRRVRPVTLAAAASAAVLLLLFAWKLRTPPEARVEDPVPAAQVTPASEPVPDTLTIAYEKVEATPENIFRYALDITPSNRLSIAIDDVANNRSIAREKEVGPEVIADLIAAIRDSGFSGLDPLYSGVAPGLLEERSLTVVIGNDAHTVRVNNRVAPEVFANLCAKLETVGKVELGMWAIQYSTEQLVSMAEQAMLQGKKLASEREIAPGNLAAAISSLNEAEWLLESVEAKPAFFADILSVRREAIEALNARYEEINFRAERAFRLRDWETASAELRMLLDVIPDREDSRHGAARKQLIEVDARRDQKR